MKKFKISIKTNDTWKDIYRDKDNSILLTVDAETEEKACDIVRNCNKCYEYDLYNTLEEQNLIFKCFTLTEIK
jgi:hypothetical protein